jgi:transcription-repair coupling factor (superfamily II helicase)
MPFEKQIGDDEVRNARLNVLAALSGDPESRPSLVVTSLAGLLQRTISRDLFQVHSQTLKIGDKVNVRTLLDRWARLGYSIEVAAETPGSASNRGGILDVFPPSTTFPHRIELLGDSIESIRQYNPISQRSERHVESVCIVPAQETMISNNGTHKAKQYLAQIQTGPTTTEIDQIRTDLRMLIDYGNNDQLNFYSGLFNTGTLLDYFPSGSLLVLDEPRQLIQEGQEIEDRISIRRKAKTEDGIIPSDFPSPFWHSHDLARFISSVSPQIHLTALEYGQGDHSLDVLPAPLFWGRMDDFASDVKERTNRGERVVILSKYTARLEEVLYDHDIGAQRIDELLSPPKRGSVTLIPIRASEGFILRLSNGSLVVLTDKEIFRQPKRQVARRRATVREAFLSELIPGNFVVHVDHGIGRFVGSKHVQDKAGGKEYLTIQYAEGDQLHVPSDSLDRLSPYFAPGEAQPSLTRLGTLEWSRLKDRARKAARDMAEELLKLYAGRQLSHGFPFSPDTTWQREMEDGFPYVETPEQLQAISEVKRGMEQPHPLDHLVCGDVGYGKTEVALRAAFKAIQDGKQVAMLCPTTILAQQHFASFTERLAPFPAFVDVLSRFRTDAECNKILRGLCNGTIDIVIGTHRLLQKDVKFKDLGLLIIDDEQRFGVAHKEKFKELRREVDVLTMTATPIPRTLYMALSGLRDMSTIQTPPELRQPVRTFVSEVEDGLIQEAISRELERGGQVFFLHNRVRDIGRWADKIRELIPSARVAVGHGQMHEEELARVMTSFLNRESDVLVCTTIIEAGVDIPNANTMIIHRPELLGLSQMYQLRGRVGRGIYQAYAYFLVPKGVSLTDKATHRLKAILAHQELGAGFRLAMKDLEIRGAGNLLGSEQSGHMAAVGFDLYSRLIEEAVEELKYSNSPTCSFTALPRAVVTLPITAFIPEEYISDMPQRLMIYQRLSRINSVEDLDKLREELRDRFGQLPQASANLVYLVTIKLLAETAGVKSVTTDHSFFMLRLIESTGGARGALSSYLGRSFHIGDKLIKGRLVGDWTTSLTSVLQDLARFRHKTLELAEQPRPEFSGGTQIPT